MRITIRNDYHNTETGINVYTGKVYADKARKFVKRKLCANPHCTCSDDFGRRGPQPYPQVMFDGFRVAEILYGVHSDAE